MMKKIAIALVALLVGLAASAQDRQTIKITHGPWLCDMTEDAVTVVWTTDQPAMSWVEYGEDLGDHFYSEERPRVYDAKHGRRLAHKTVHTVRLTGLKPGTKYQYRIFSQHTVDWSFSDYVKLGEVAASVVYKHEPFRFTTFSPDDKEVTFFVVNDVHGRKDDLKALCKDVDFSKYDFVLLNGDMLSSLENEQQMFDGWLDACVEMFASNTPIQFARGNHENRGKFADHLFEYFPTHTGNFYYTFNVGKTGFIVCDPGEDKPDSDIEYGGIAEFDPYREIEAAWIREAAKNLEGSQKIAICHVPPTTRVWHGDNELQRLFFPALTGNGIDLMLSGHLHEYNFVPANAQHDFPILVNDNKSYLSVTVKDGKIVTDIISSDPKASKSHTFRTKK